MQLSYEGNLTGLDHKGKTTDGRIIKQIANREQEGRKRAGKQTFATVLIVK